MQRRLPTNFTCISRGILLFLVSMILFVWPLAHYDSSEDVQESSLGTKLFLVMVVVGGGVHLALMILKLRRVTSNVVVAVNVGNPV
jgi:drug/metabolite transporter (DMT)-like permease